METDNNVQWIAAELIGQALEIRFATGRIMKAGNRYEATSRKLKIGKQPHYLTHWFDDVSAAIQWIVLRDRLRDKNK